MPSAPDDPLSPDLRAQLGLVLARGHGTATSRDLRSLGLGTAQVATIVRREVLLHVARGAFVDGEAYAMASPRERHVLRARAVARTWPDGTAVSHTSGAVMLELPVRRLDERIHGCRIAAGQHRKNSVYTLHTGYVGASGSEVGGVMVLEPRFVVMGIAELLGRDAAVMTADAALHRGILTVPELQTACDARLNHPAHALLERSIQLVDARTESPGETLARILMLDLGMVPVPQVEIYDAEGLVGRVDFLLEGTKVVVEFDGMMKYGSPEDLVAEKRRELRLQRAGYVVVRLVWADLKHPERVRALLRGALAAAA